MDKEAKILILLLLILCENISFSQQLSHQVMVPSAGLAMTGSVNYSQTVGETAIEIISSSGFVFTQGFQQPSIVYSAEHQPEGNGVDVYPNPATDYIKVKFFGDAARKFSVNIININGTIIISKNVNFITGYFHEEPIDVGNMKKGFYFVRIVSSDGLISRTFKIEKM